MYIITTMEIHRLEPLTLNKVYNVLSATHISAAQKEEFVMVNRTEINELLLGKINTASFQTIMQGRKLQLFKPLKNSYTKAGDKKILAKALGIATGDVDSYIHGISEAIEDGEITDYPKDKIEMIMTYVYRHGKKNELLNFVDYELSSAKDILGVLYRTLEYNAGGAADYFVRPIHRLDNKTIVSLYDIIDKNLKNAVRTGDLSAIDCERTSEWALVRIYEIQNNQKLKNALRLKRELES